MVGSILPMFFIQKFRFLSLAFPVEGRYPFMEKRWESNYLSRGEFKYPDLENKVAFYAQIVLIANEPDQFM